MLTDLWVKELGQDPAQVAFFFEQGLDFDAMKQRARVFCSEKQSQGYGCLSRSHTEFEGRRASLAIAVKCMDLAGVGVDLEAANRPITDVLWQRLASQPEQKLFEQDRIGLWCLKESSFKADPRTTKSVITQYQICSGKNERPRLMSMDVDAIGFKAALGFFENWRVALCFTPKE